MLLESTSWYLAIATCILKYSEASDKDDTLKAHKEQFKGSLLYTRTTYSTK